MRFRGILFDLDGTLVDSIDLYEQAVLRSLEEIGITATHEEFFAWYVTPLHLAQILANHGMSEDLVPSLRLRRDEIYIELLRTKSQWLPGAQELLQSLAAVPLGMITGSWMTYVNAIDEKLNLKHSFKTIITADNMHQFMKPHPHGLLLATDQLAVDPKDCVYIGDQLFDLEAAKNAGMEGWLIKGKWTPKKLTGLTGLAEVSGKLGY